VTPSSLWFHAAFLFLFVAIFLPLATWCKGFTKGVLLYSFNGRRVGWKRPEERLQSTYSSSYLLSTGLSRLRPNE
jgi:hypothetical protein